MVADKKSLIFSALEQFYKANGKLPTAAEFKRLGISKDKIRHHFGNMHNLYDIFYQKKEILTLANSKKATKNLLKSCDRFVVTTAISGCTVNKSFLRTLENYAKVNKAQILIVPMLNNSQLEFSHELKHLYFVENEFSLNDNCKILNIHYSPKTPDPTTGISHIGNRNNSIILPGTTFRLRFVATGLNKLPHAIMTTGCITNPDHVKNVYESKKDYVSSNTHTFGAIVVEIENNTFFHFRQLTFKDGVICDLGKKYTKNTVTQAKNVLVCGDWHCGKTHQTVKEKTIALAKKLKSHTMILHDLFDAYSISHHEVNKMIVKAKKALDQKLSLEHELNNYADEIYQLAKKHKQKLVIVRSNHDEHLNKYIEEVRFTDDPINFFTAAKLVSFLMVNKNPLEEFVRQKFKEKLNVTWLQRDESFVVYTIELGVHGDKGANGNYPTLGQLENSYGDVVIGHRHTPEIKGRVWVVGTSTDTKPDYGTGPTSWMNTHCIVYENGTRQLVNFINNKFYLDRL